MTTFLPDGTMEDEMAQFDLTKEIADSESRKPWEAGRYAKTLFKKHDLRVVLITLENGARLKEHHADGAISVQVLKGKIRLSIHDKQHELGVGSLLALAASIHHDVEAEGDSAFLLTVSWPSEKELASMEHRGPGYAS